MKSTSVKKKPVAKVVKTRSKTPAPANDKITLIENKIGATKERLEKQVATVANTKAKIIDLSKVLKSLQKAAGKSK